LCKSIFPEEINPPVGFETDLSVVVNSLQCELSNLFR
jgi:hypothetical protein